MTAVAIFVKTPGVSPIKTRLARSLGSELAEACYRRSLTCVADTVQNSGLAGYWAVAETEALDDPLWRQLPTINQNPGSLGQRMQHVHTQLVRRHGSAILVGADLPQLCAEDLAAASDWLQSGQPRSVLGPASDGGFWLYGANHVHAASVWTSVPYSQADTAERFVRAMTTGEWKRLATRRDIDQVEDIAQVVHELDQLAKLSQSQRAFAVWLAELADE